MKIVLAFSGGLDTSVILKWLVDKGYDVVTYTADVGQKEDFNAVKKKALEIGAEKAYVVDLKEDFLKNYVFKALKANAVYEGLYLLGTALARPAIAKTQVEIAKAEHTTMLAHGCTAKGNDQVRFELTWLRFMPNVKIVAPWRDKKFLKMFKGRKDLIKYAKENGIPITASLEKPYSVDENLMHISYESGVLEDISKEYDMHIFKGFKVPQKAKDKGDEVVVEFDKGIPVLLEDKENGVEKKEPLEIFTYLNHIGSENGIGMVDMVENRFIGIKSRGIYISPAATILWKLHKDLESITLDKGVMHLKGMISPIIGKLIYEGFWFSPEMEFLMSAVEQSQKNVSGRIHFLLYKGNIIIKKREAEKSLYSKSLASMDTLENFDPSSSEGFIKTLALRFKLGLI